MVAEPLGHFAQAALCAQSPFAPWRLDPLRPRLVSFVSPRSCRLVRKATLVLSRESGAAMPIVAQFPGLCLLLTGYRKRAIKITLRLLLRPARAT